MYVAVATASRAAEEAAPVPAVREAQTHLKPLTFSSTLAPTAADHRSHPFTHPFEPFVNQGIPSGIAAAPSYCVDARKSDVATSDVASDLIVQRCIYVADCNVMFRSLSDCAMERRSMR